MSGLHPPSQDQQRELGKCMAAAVLDGDAAAVRELIKKQVDPNIILNAFHHTPLHLAAALGELDIVELLLEHGANINAITAHDQTAVSAAYHNGQAAVLQALWHNQQLDLLLLMVLAVKRDDEMFLRYVLGQALHRHEMIPLELITHLQSEFPGHHLVEQIRIFAETAFLFEQIDSYTFPKRLLAGVFQTKFMEHGLTESDIECWRLFMSALSIRSRFDSLMPASLLASGRPNPEFIWYEAKSAEKSVIQGLEHDIVLMLKRYAQGESIAAIKKQMYVILLTHKQAAHTSLNDKRATLFGDKKVEGALEKHITEVISDYQSAATLQPFPPRPR